MHHKESDSHHYRRQSPRGYWHIAGLCWSSSQVRSSHSHHEAAIYTMWPCSTSRNNAPLSLKHSPTPTDSTPSCSSMGKYCCQERAPPRGTLWQWLYIPLQQYLINRLQQQITQVWFADNTTAGWKLLDLRDWWDQLVECGHECGYSANASKTWLVVKPE